MGGSGSSSNATNNHYFTDESTTNIDIPLDELANAITKASEGDSEVLQKLTLATLAQEKALKVEELNQKENNDLRVLETFKSIGTIGIGIVGLFALIYFTKSNKKGK